jgi:peptidoglycan/LPS O-acetylase OafA/YrhL
MTRTFFYVLVFPPAFMNLMLVHAAPDNLLRYFLAGYLVAAVPGAAIALTDEMLARATVPKRANWCGLVGLLSAPMAMGLLADLGPFGDLLTSLCGGLAAFLCTLAYAKVEQRTAAAVPR